MNKKHGGPAFPFNYHNQTRDYQECFATDGMIAPDGAAQYKGLSVRDYFAAAAVQGMCADPNWRPQLADAARRAFPGADDMQIADFVAQGAAQAAYMFADAMLKAGGYDE